MPQRAHTIRASDTLWEAFKDEAHNQGISASQWVVEAALSRLVHVRVRRDHQVAVEMDAIYRAVEELKAP